MAIIVISIDANFESCKSIKEKIVKIDAIIESLFTTALKSVQNGDIVQYSLDDGQTRISRTYSSTSSITKGIKEYEAIRQMYANKLVSRQVRLVDSKSIRNGNIY